MCSYINRAMKYAKSYRRCSPTVIKRKKDERQQYDTNYFHWVAASADAASMINLSRPASDRHKSLRME